MTPWYFRKVILELFSRKPAVFAALFSQFGPGCFVTFNMPASLNARLNGFTRVPLLDRGTTSTYFLADDIREICHRTTEDAAVPSILLPPSHLLEEHQFNTLDSYIRGGVKVNGESRAHDTHADFNKDMVHGNIEYGKEIAAHILNFFSKN